MAQPKYAYLSFQSGVDWHDVNPVLLRKINSLGRSQGQVITITSGYRSIKEQQYLWDNAAALGLVRGVTVAAPGTSDHQHGTAVDAVVNGVPIGKAFSRESFIKVGLKYLPRDQVHVTFLSSKEGGSFTPGGGGGTDTAPVDATAPPDAATDPNQAQIDQLNQQTQNNIANIDQPGGTPGASAPLVGDTTDTNLLPQQSNAASTWQLIAQQGNVSQDTIRLAQMAQLGANGTSPGQ